MQHDAVGVSPHAQDAVRGAPRHALLITSHLRGDENGSTENRHPVSLDTWSKQ